MTGSRQGSITRLRLMNISLRVMRLMRHTADLRDSASLMNVPTRLYNWLTVARMRLWWCLHALRTTLQASNCANQSWL